MGFFYLDYISTLLTSKRDQPPVPLLQATLSPIHSLIAYIRNIYRGPALTYLEHAFTCQDGCLLYRHLYGPVTALSMMLVTCDMVGIGLVWLPFPEVTFECFFLKHFIPPVGRGLPLFLPSVRDSLPGPGPEECLIRKDMSTARRRRDPLSQISGSKQ